jgi:hypothetical protein
MKQNNSIVRTKTTSYNKNGDYYCIELMPYENYILKSEYIFPNQKFKLYAYKWYDIRYLVDYPYYFLFKYLTNPKVKHLNLSSTSSVIIRIFLSFVEIVIPSLIKILIFG